MTVMPLPSARVLDISDGPLPSASAASAGDVAVFSGAVSGAFADASARLERADAAERAFATGRGGLQEMVLERAQADVALSIASAVASRTAQSLTTVLGMQL